MNRVVVAAIPPVGQRVEVDAPGSHHLLHAQRVARGAPVELIDAGGRRARGHLVDVTPLAVVQVDAHLPDRVVPGRVVLLGRPRGPALDEVVTAAVEGGATELWIVEAERSPPGAARLDRLDRLQRAAMTQSGSAHPVDLVGPLRLGEALARPLPARRHLAAPMGPAVAPTSDPVVLAVGPEGGWSPTEEARLGEAGFLPMGLGPWILRTPTAVTAALGRLWPGG